jgi:glycosyltransferase involved in cell wall biosynthesis
MVLSFCNSVDGIIAPSNAIKEYLDSYAVKIPIKVIPSSLQSIFFPKKCVIKKRSLSDYFHILIVSRFTKEKNVFFLLDVFSRLDQCFFDLTLVGFGVEYDGLQKYAYEILKLSRKKVRFIHKPERHVIAQCYCNADLFLFSSRHDTQGLVLAEAMSGGTPVIALDGPGQRDIIVNGVNGFIVKDSIAMIEKINLLKNDSLLHMRMKKMAQKVSFRYMPEPLTEQLLNFYVMLRNKVINDS